MVLGMNVEASGDVSAAEATAVLARRIADKSAALARIAAGVAHELRNPLAVILARAQLLVLGLRQGRTPDPEKIETVLKTIEAQAIRAAKIVENLSVFARPRPPEIDSVDTAAVVEDVLSALGERVETSGAAVEVAIERAPVMIVADREQLATALEQIVANALEAMESGGRVTVRVRRSGDSVEIAVADTGPGVAAHHAERIFDPFFSTKTAAAGLGLCVAQTIAEAHGGGLRLVAAGGAGAEFVLSLPAGA